MAELKRVLLGRKSLMLLGILLLLHAVFFFYQCNEMKRETLTEDELQEYVDGYSLYVEGVLESSNEMLENPLFSNQTSFVYENIIKTAQDYATLQDIQPVYGENRGIMTMVPFQLTGYLLLLMGIFYVLSFMAERQKGLYLLVRCTYRGRMPLSFERIGTLILGITACGILFSLSILPIMLLRFPGTTLLRPVQSIPECSGVMSHVTIWGYLCMLVFRRILGCIVTCMLLYFCMSLLRSSLCVLLFLGLFLGEYLLYALLLPTDQLCILRYVNLYTMIFAPQDYAHYLNLNFFGTPILTGSLSIRIALICFVLLSLLCVLQYGRQYPKAEGKRFPLFDRMAAWYSRKKPQLTPFLWECKKILLSQKALIILALIIYLAWSSSNEISYRDYRSKYVLKWYQTFAGTVDDQKLKDIDKQMTKLEEKLDMYEKSLVTQLDILERYTIRGYDTSVVGSNVVRLRNTIKEYKLSISGLNVVKDHAKMDYDFTKESGIAVDLVDPTFYELLLHKDYQTVRKNYLYVLIAIILMLSGVMSCETSSHVKPTLHVLYRGGRAMIIRKVIIVFALSVLCALSIHLIQFFQIYRIIPQDAQNVIAQSIPCVRYLPVIMSIRTYVILLYAFRALIAFGLSLIVMLISNYSKS
ncbi:MAG: hypothetical protein J6Z22_08915, partial [Lachnospiraceae bacterium]|nr:hypothetical protein [Lachnospiraceae bacterium]